MTTERIQNDFYHLFDSIIYVVKHIIATVIRFWYTLYIIHVMCLLLLVVLQHNISK